MPRRRKSPVSLSGGDRVRLEGLIAGGNAPARKMTHARASCSRPTRARMLPPGPT